MHIAMCADSCLTVKQRNAMERTPREPGKHDFQRPYGVANMSVQELLRLSQEVGRKYQESREQLHPDNLERHGALDNLNALTEELRLLPQDNPERSIEFFVKLSESKNSFDREHVAAAIDEIAKVNPELGTSLWVKLIRDSEGTVYEYAHGAIERAAEDSHFPKEILGVLAADLANALWASQDRYGE
ncbi:hypothetical protein [Glycomyces salinus]|uniref:hypothetical protein n=1 Tax=Glycomyces salinus TaxID=980294 RepID=UPI0018EAA3C1|nr:hypothetical protein [Glycomyces salinus]